MTKSIVITGVSSGFGLAAAKELTSRGYLVFGSVRKEADAERVTKEIGSTLFTPLLFDVTDRDAVLSAAAVVADKVGVQGVDALINNAGIAPSGPLAYANLDQFRQTLDVNVVAVLGATQAFLPLLRAGNQPGRVVNISSISGGVTFPMLGVYATSKHALEALNDGLRRELALYGIEVSAIEPGTIRTPIWEKAAADAEKERFAGTDYAESMLKLKAMSERELERAKPISVVIDAICHAIESRRPRTRYPLVGLWHIRRWVGDRLFDRMIKMATGI